LARSLCERIVSASGRPTVVPGPTVHGPPMKSSTRPPHLPTLRSSSDVAMESAAPPVISRDDFYFLIAFVSA
jgi:hypothetical protein